MCKIYFRSPTLIKIDIAQAQAQADSDQLPYVYFSQFIIMLLLNIVIGWTD